MAIPPNPLSRALRGLDSQQAGQYAPNAAPQCTQNSQALTASRGYVIRFVAERSMTITKMAFALTVSAGANDNCDVGIFNSSLTTLLGSSGSTAGKLNASPGVQTVNLAAPVSIRQGKVYYAAFASGTQGGTAASVTTTSTQTFIGTLFGSTAGVIEQTFNNAEFPLAAPFSVSGVISFCPILALLQ